MGPWSVGTHGTSSAPSVAVSNPKVQLKETGQPNSLVVYGAGLEIVNGDYTLLEDGVSWRMSPCQNSGGVWCPSIFNVNGWWNLNCAYNGGTGSENWQQCYTMQGNTNTPPTGPWSVGTHGTSSAPSVAVSNPKVQLKETGQPNSLVVYGAGLEIVNGDYTLLEDGVSWRMSPCQNSGGVWCPSIFNVNGWWNLNCAYNGGTGSENWQQCY